MSGVVWLKNILPVTVRCMNFEGVFTCVGGDPCPAQNCMPLFSVNFNSQIPSHLLPPDNSALPFFYHITAIPSGQGSCCRCEDVLMLQN